MKKASASRAHQGPPASRGACVAERAASAEPAISACLPLRRLGHEPGDGYPAGNRHNRENKSHLIPSEAQLTNTEQRGIDEDAPQDPAQKILPQIARDGLVSCELRYGMPSGDLRANFPVRL